MTIPDRGSLTGQHAVITGGGRGIGAAIAEALARAGASLTIMSRDTGVAEQTASHLRNTYDVPVLVALCDVGDPASIRRAFDAARQTHGAPYILVNNAGQAVSARLEDTTFDMWSTMLAVNLTGTYLCTQEVISTMRTARAGRIVNIASTAGLKGYSHTAAYSASKHGVIGFTRALAAETAKHGITVNAVCPGYTDTAMHERAVDSLAHGTGKSDAEARALLVRNNPRGTLITPAEVANTVAWLCGAEASAITGQSIAVAGGEVM